MGLNEWLLLIQAVVGASLVVSVWRLDEGRLWALISVLLILIATAGPKLVTVFGYEMRAAAILYGCVFLATYFLIERYGARQGVILIWWGAITVAAYLAMGELTTTLAGAGETTSLDLALSEVFTGAVRVALASLSAYLVSQSLNVYLYLYLKRRFDDGRIWLRAVLTSAIADAVHGAVFAAFALAGFLTQTHLGVTLLTGYLVKVGFMALAAPLLYLNNVEHSDEDGVASIRIRYDRVMTWWSRGDE